MYIESQEDTCSIYIDEDMEVEYESSDEDYDNRDLDSGLQLRIRGSI